MFSLFCNKVKKYSDVTDTNSTAINEAAFEELQKNSSVTLYDIPMLDILLHKEVKKVYICKGSEVKRRRGILQRTPFHLAHQRASPVCSAPL